jgi:aminoglycoside phosphotransferase (APT) family kinase protein
MARFDVAAADVADALREGLESGDYSALVGRYASDAQLDAGLAGERALVVGPAAIARRFAEWWPGRAELVEWSCDAHPDGIAVWWERVDHDGAAHRQRHYLHVEDGRVTRHWAYAAPPRTTAPNADDDETAARAFSAVGPVARREVVASSGWSGNRIERAVLEDGRRLIAKRVVPGADWLGRETLDRGREGLLFSSGALARLPAAIDTTVITATEADGAWWIVMRDVEGALLDDDGPIPRARHRQAMAAANTMWKEFWGERLDALAPLALRLRCAAPSTAERERDGLDLLPNQLEAAWAGFAEAADEDVAGPVLRLVEDPAPLVAALEGRGTTLIHGDLRDEQMGFEDERMILIDWGLATQGHPVVELAWYLMHNGWRIEATRDELVEDFRRARGDADDLDALQLGYVTGLVMYGWVIGHSAVVHPDPAERAWAREELAFWVPRARRGLELLSP